MKKSDQNSPHRLSQRVRYEVMKWLETNRERVEKFQNFSELADAIKADKGIETTPPSLRSCMRDLDIRFKDSKGSVTSILSAKIADLEKRVSILEQLLK